MYLKEQAVEEQELINRLVSWVVYIAVASSEFDVYLLLQFFGRTTYLALPRSNKSFHWNNQH